MTSLSRTRLLRPTDGFVGLAEACVGLPGVAGNRETRPGDDLLRRLPTDRESTRAPAALVEASYDVAGERMISLSRAAATWGAGRDAIFLTAFAVLLARLAGQDAVTLRDIAVGSRLLTLTFGSDESFRSALMAIVCENASASGRPCTVEFLSTSSQVFLPDLPEYCLRLAVHTMERGAYVRLTSTTGLWDHSVLRLWLRYFDCLLTAAVTAPDTPWKRLPLLSPMETHGFYRIFNDTAVAYPEDVCVHELVKAQARTIPDAVAIASELQQITYRQLDERSNAIAHRLRALGAGPDRPVAVCLERSVELPMALLGVLKAGSCYVPLDPQDAPQRLAAILEECRPAAIIVDRSFVPLSGSDALPVYLDNIPESSAAVDCRAQNLIPGNHAYIIYTSGTTGKPKGVVIQHRALSNLLHSLMQAPGFKASDRLVAVSPISFDIATMDMFLPLVAGGTLVIADRLIAADPFRLAAMLERFEATVLFATPITWRLLVSSGWQGKHDLRMITGGEALPRDLANQLLRLGKELWNCYGPTETTIMSGVLRMEAEEGVVPIGPPIANTTFYVRDEAGRLLPPGVPGELYIGGTGVSPGYVDPSQDSGQRFLPDPYAPLAGSRVFRSGDLVRLINGNEFEFFGRLDHQVKLRGYRIEMGEIESALRTFPHIKNAVAALCENGPGDPYLIAYFTALDKQLDLRRLRDHISRLLPAYMVPNRFVLMHSMPLTASGKIDRKTLVASAPSGLSAYRQPDGVEPRTALERKLLIIFRDVLNTADFGVTDSFFDYGGYSLLTVKLFNRINRALKLALPISLLFDAPTVRALAVIIESAQPLSLIVPIRPRGRSAPLFVIHSYLLYGVLPHIVEPDRPVYGVRELMDVSQSQTIEDRAAIYVKEILRVYPDGPLLLTGWCAAGSLTVEIACQLRQLDHQVGLVALFDAERPGYRPVFRRNRSVRLLSKVRFHVRRLRGASIRQKLHYVRNGLRHIWDTMCGSLFMHHRRLVMGLQRIFGFSLPDVVFNNTWSRVAALQNYAPARYPGRVILFRAADVPQLPLSDETLGWKEVVDDGVEVVFVPGDHESMFHTPNVEFFSSRFRQALQRAE